MRPVVNGLKPKYAGRVDFREVDFYQNRDLATQYSVPGHPTLVVTGADGSAIEVLPGISPEASIVDALDSALK